MKSTPFFPQVHFSAAMNANQAGNTPLAKAHAAAVSAALSAAAVYGEWAPLAPLMRSGMLDACAHFLSSPEFRSQACEVLRHVAHRRRGDVVNNALSGGGKVANVAPGAEDAGEQEAAEDATSVVDGFSKMCRSIGVAVTQVLSQGVTDSASEEREYVVRLTETAAAIASNHLHVLPDLSLKYSFLEALLGLTKYPTLDTLGPSVSAWPGLLRNAGAELPNGFQRPDKKDVGSGVYGAQHKDLHFQKESEKDENRKNVIPPECVVALLETTKFWLQSGGGLAAGLLTSKCYDAKSDDWELEYETREELREVWVVLRARLMEVTKLCTFLNPVAAANAAANCVAGTVAMVKLGGALDPAANPKPGVNSSDEYGRSALDDAVGCAFEGTVSFVEPVVQALPFLGVTDADRNTIAQVMPALDASLAATLAVELTTPVGVSQMSRLLEALGRCALARADAGTATLNRLFEILGRLPSDDIHSPPARAKAALMAGRTAQAARQRVCAAILGVCTAAPEVRGYYVCPFKTYYALSSSFRFFFHIIFAWLRSPSEASTRRDVCCRARESVRAPILASSRSISR